MLRDDDELNDSWFDHPGRELRREQILPLPPPPEVTEAPGERRDRDSLADPWFV